MKYIFVYYYYLWNMLTNYSHTSTYTKRKIISRHSRWVLIKFTVWIYNEINFIKVRRYLTGII